MKSRQQRRVRYQNGTLEHMPRKSGPDVWTYRFVDRANDRQRRVILGTVTEFETDGDVMRAAESHRLSANRNSNLIRAVTMAAFIDRYERECVAPFVEIAVGALDNRRPSVQSARSYRSLIGRWIRPKWAGCSLAEFEHITKATAIEEWLAALLKSTYNPAGLAPKTVGGIRSLLRLMFRKAVKWGYLAHSPMVHVELLPGSTRRQTKPMWLTPAQFVDVLKLYEDPMLHAAIAVAGWLGTRRSEGFGLQCRTSIFRTGRCRSCGASSTGASRRSRQRLRGPTPVCPRMS